MVYANINCIHRHNKDCCTCKDVRKSILDFLFGFGDKQCVLYYTKDKCEFQEMYKKPNISPPPQPKGT